MGTAAEHMREIALIADDLDSALQTLDDALAKQREIAGIAEHAILVARNECDRLIAEFAEHEEE